jgi:hypothetical protein
MSHTPGPWVQGTPQKEKLGTAVDIFDASATQRLATVFSRKGEDNAALIAAAPMLVQWLQRVDSFMADEEESVQEEHAEDMHGLRECLRSLGCSTIGD